MLDSQFRRAFLADLCGNVKKNQYHETSNLFEIDDGEVAFRDAEISKFRNISVKVKESKGNDRCHFYVKPHQPQQQWDEERPYFAHEIPDIHWEMEVQDAMIGKKHHTLHKDMIRRFIRKGSKQNGDIKVGSNVEVKIVAHDSKRDRWCPGMVMSVNETDGTFDVAYDDIDTTTALTTSRSPRPIMSDITFDLFDAEAVDERIAFGFAKDHLEELIPNPDIDEFDDSDLGHYDELETRYADGTAPAVPARAEGGADSSNRGVTSEDKPLSQGGGGGGAAGAALTLLSRSTGQAHKRLRGNMSQTRSRQRARVSGLNNSIIADKHKNTRLDMTENELKHFHRPRIPEMQKHRKWVVSFEGSKVGEGAALNRFKDIEKEKSDLSIARGDFICVEYVEEFPPLVLNLGMASAVRNYFRSPEQPDVEEKRQKTKTDELRKQVMVSTVRVPRHMRLLLQQRDTRQTYDQDDRMPKMEVGEMEVLLRGEDESPFLGEIEENETVQSLFNKLFRAPMFEHRPSKSDFLLVRTKNRDSDHYHFTIRSIPKLFVSGQIEPHVTVPKPSRTMTELQEHMVALAAFRFFMDLKDGQGVDPKQIEEEGFEGKKSTRFYKTKGFFRYQMQKRFLAKVADEVGDRGTGKKWFPKEYVNSYGDAMEDEERQERVTVEDLERVFYPEDVCVQSSCNAAELRLSLLGIADIELGTVLQWLERMRLLKSHRLKMAAYAKKLAVEQRAGPGSPLVRLVDMLVAQCSRLGEKIKVAQFIYGRLIVAPWNTTDAFVKSQSEGQGSNQTKIEVEGQGDPSGIGEGFAFVRMAQGSTKKEGPVTGIAGKEQDLRKMKKPQLIQTLLNFGVPLDQILQLHRWGMVDKVRTYVTLAGDAAGSLQKYARTGIVQHQTNRLEQFKRKCQEIWNRQKLALSDQSRAGFGSSSPRRQRDSDDDDDDDEDDDDEDDDVDLLDEKNEDANLVRQLADKMLEEDKAKGGSKHEQEDEEEYNSLLSGDGADILAPSAAAAAVVATSKGSEGGGPMGGRGRGRGGAGGAAGGRKSNVKAVIDGGGSSNSLVAMVGMPGMGSGAVGGKLVFRPQRVVKQVKRTVCDDGTETIEIRFILSQHEVQRVLVKTDEARLQREQYLKREERGLNEGSLLADAAEEALAALAAVKPLTLRLDTHKHIKEGKRKDPQDDNDDEVVLPIIKSRSRGQPKPINKRLPHIQFAAELEKKVFEVWSSKPASMFQEPVAASTAQGYYDRIKDPICLRDIRNKIAKFEYTSVREVLDDFDLMAANAETYNGKDNPIAKQAGKVRDTMVFLLMHKANTLGRDLDELSQLEIAIKKRFSQLHRFPPRGGGSSINRPAPRPSHPAPAPGPLVHVLDQTAPTMPAQIHSAPAAPPAPPLATSAPTSMGGDDDDSGEDEVMDEGGL